MAINGSIDSQVHIDLPCFPEFNSDLEFVQRLLMEESVFCLPGQVLRLNQSFTIDSTVSIDYTFLNYFSQCFDYPSYMRLVITVPMDMLEEACQRIQEFCERHHYKTAEHTRRSSFLDGEISC